MRYLLVGNYGVGNPGDEALKEYILGTFPEIQWIVVSARPERGEVPRLPMGIRSLLSSPWWKTLQAYRWCDGVVFGGGSLFTDAESLFACVLWSWHGYVAWLFRKPMLLAFQGVGPFRTRLGEGCARWVVRHALFLSIRDSLSAGRMTPWKLNKKFVQTFDPVFSLVMMKNIRRHSVSTVMSSDSDRTKNLLIIPRKNSSREFWRMAREIQQRKAWDDIQICEPRTFTELCTAVGLASFLLTQRYHAGITALALGVPFEAIPQVPGDKLDALNQEDRERERLRERVRMGEEALHEALQASSPRGRGSR